MPGRGCLPRTPEPYSEWLGVICLRGAPLTYRTFLWVFMSLFLFRLASEPSRKTHCFRPLSRPLSSLPRPRHSLCLCSPGGQCSGRALTFLLPIEVVSLDAFTPPNLSQPHQEDDSEFQPDAALPGSCGVEPSAHLCSCLFLNIVCFVSVALVYSVFCTYCKETVGSNFLSRWAGLAPHSCPFHFVL